MRLLTITLGVISIWLFGYLIFGKNGLSDYYTALRAVESVEATNSNLRTRNQEMYADIVDLRSGIEAIEERARNELGMIKPNETFFRIVQ